MLFQIKMTSVKESVLKYKSLISNFGYLTAVQMLNMLLPLISYPYLIRVLGSELYGLVVFAQSIAMYFAVLINYGSNFSGTKEIAIHKNSNKKLSIIFSSILNIKLIFFFLSATVMVLFATFIPAFEKHYFLYIFTIGVLINETLFPIWFFQGVEQMKYITFITLLSKSIFTILIFVVITEKTDYYIVPLLSGLGSFVASIISIYIIFENYKITFVFSKNYIKRYLKESFSLLISNFITVIRSETNRIILGIFIGMKEVAYYDLANKVILILRGLIKNIDNVFFPRISKDKDMALARKSVFISFFLSAGAYISILLFKKPIVLLLGGSEMLPSVNIFYILGLWIVFASISTSFGVIVLLTNNHNKAFATSLFISLLFFIGSNAILIYTNTVNIETLSWALILSIIIEAAIRFYFSWKYKLLNWIYKF